MIKVTGRFFRGVFLFLEMWVVGMIIMGLLVWVTRIDAMWYFVVPFAAIPYSLVAVFGNILDKRKLAIKQNQNILKLEAKKYIENKAEIELQTNKNK